MPDGDPRYANLFEPIRLAGLTVPNRIARGAHGTSLPWVDVSDDLITYHAERARNGVGLLFLEKGGVHPSSGSLFPLFERSSLPHIAKLAAAIHEHESKMFVQLLHRGAAYPNPLGGPPWSASEVPNPEVGRMPLAMTKAMIEEVVAGFAAAARHVQEGGLDGVEIHAAHGYLLTEFLSPTTNHRDDEYGGSPENRMRFMLEIIDAVRAEVGPDFPICVRLPADEEAEGGLTPPDVADVARALEARIDLLSVSLGSYYRFHRTLSTADDEVGYQLPASQVVTRAVSTPTLVTGRILTLAHASTIVGDGTADLVSIVRALIADPYLVTKSRAGREREVRPCTGTNEGCIGQIGPNGRLACVVNVAAGQEANTPFDPGPPAAVPRRVLVAGGGPAGLEAARSAAMRGHHVVVCEAADHVGGQLAIAASAPHRADVGSLVTYLSHELERLGVDVRLKTTVDAALVQAERPDVVVVATGSRPRADGFHAFRPTRPITGFDLPHVRTSWDVLGFGQPVEVGEHAVVYDDTGRFEAISAAEALLVAGAAVTFVTPLDLLGARMPAPMATIGAARERLFAGRFTLLTNSVIDEISAHSVRVARRGTSNVTAHPAGVVVLVGYNEPQRQLGRALAGSGIEVHVIGDADGGNTIQHAVHTAAQVGRAL